MNNEKYAKEKNELVNFRSKVSNYSFTVFVLWIIFFLGFIIWWLFKENLPSQTVGFSLQSLNLMGGAFNIIIALTGVITVWLLSKAVSFQKEELINIQWQMDSQRETIEKEERVNRTIDLIHKWTSLDEHVDEPFTRGSSSDPIPKEKKGYIGIKQADFIKHLMLIEGSSEEYKGKIDFNVICQAILNDNAKRGIETRIFYIKHDLLKLRENNFNKYEEWSHTQIESLEDGSVEKYSLTEIHEYKEMIAFLEKYG